MEFKIKYLCSYAALMRNYFIHMNMVDISNELMGKNKREALFIILIACKFVEPDLDIPDLVDECTDEHLHFCHEFMKTETFKAKFLLVCQMETIPSLSLQQMKNIRCEFIDKIIN